MDSIDREPTVADVMTREVVSAGLETTLGEIAALMIARRLRAVPIITDTGAVVGMITDREVMDRLLPSIGDRTGPLTGQIAASSILVKELMDRTVMCVSDDQSLRDVAASMLNKGIERFPVVAHGALVGFVTLGDIIRQLLVPGGPDARSAESVGSEAPGATEAPDLSGDENIERGTE